MLCSRSWSCCGRLCQYVTSTFLPCRSMASTICGVVGGLLTAVCAWAAGALVGLAAVVGALVGWAAGVGWAAVVGLAAAAGGVVGAAAGALVVAPEPHAETNSAAPIRGVQSARMGRFCIQPFLSS